MRKKGLLGVFSILVALSATAETQPLLIYTIGTDSETVDSWKLGLVTGLVGEGIRQAHKPFLEAIEAETVVGAEPPGFLQPLICLETPCRRAVHLSSPLTDDSLIAELGREPTHSARVVELLIIFDGRFFQVIASMKEMSLDANGKLMSSHSTLGTYVTTYSKSMHAQEIRDHTIDARFTGNVGSKDARAHYWMAGSKPRLLRELHEAVQFEAALWAARLSADMPGELSGDPAQRTHLQTVQEVVARDVPKCKTLHPKLLVVKDLGEHFWLAMPGDAGKRNPDNFLIERRCGYDF